MSTIYKRGHAELEANLTPMIDVTFLLIVFFVLVSQIVSKENQPMDLPMPTDPASEQISEEVRAVINLVHAGDGRPRELWLGTRAYPATPQGVQQLTDRLEQLYASNRTLQVNLRADRAIHYVHVQQMMDAISRAAARIEGEPIRPRINLAVERREL